ncbi:MAG: beta-ketoacyl-ACP synthase II [Chloroflexota bacterium]
MGRPRVAVTGVGVISPIGLNAEDFWTSLVSGKSGVRLISRFDTSDFPVKVAAEINDFDPAKYMDPKTVDRTSRSTQFAVAAAKEAVDGAGLDMSRESPDRVGVVASNMVETDYIAEGSEAVRTRGYRRGDPLFITKSSPSVIAMRLGMLLGARGPNTSVNSLCASGADAIGAAFNFIRLGYADVMIAGGADATLGLTNLAGLAIVGALSREADPARACRPYDLNRSGFVYGEGAGIVVMETFDHARSRGARVLVELAGAGWSFDAYNETAPDSEAEALAMSVALRDAGVRPEEVDHVNSHGTATKLNDSCETRAIKKVFGQHAYRLPVTSNKSMLGHLITAGGAVEFIGAALSISRGVIPPTINYETPDPECDLDYVPNSARNVQTNVCLKDSFGLGGENCCLVLKRFGAF